VKCRIKKTALTRRREWDCQRIDEQRLRNRSDKERSQDTRRVMNQAWQAHPSSCLPLFLSSSSLSVSTPSWCVLYYSNALRLDLGPSPSAWSWSRAIRLPSRQFLTCPRSLVVMTSAISWASMGCSSSHPASKHSTRITFTRSFYMELRTCNAKFNVSCVTKNTTTVS